MAAVRGAPIVDSHSRSSLGSLILLFTASSHVPTLLAAIISLLAITAGPFTQQAVQTFDRMQVSPKGIAAPPVAQYVGDDSRIVHWVEEIVVDSPDMPPNTCGVPLNGPVNPQSNDSRIVLKCSTGNCTFTVDSRGATHYSMGVCSE
ncbi:hypothetical protein QQS21_003664 [Conoideocrella luteorostrata]|uniref:Uncharacterized protein n=1 Tax=Conoideocrella luteorostrata TaxID=1105319 RepID=A0AAJ0CVW6_9HYPO|nr:hypothetical protein QQS21_003664 [Conoideocrella luteorostrata]